MNIETTRINRHINLGVADFIADTNSDYMHRLSLIADEIEKNSPQKSVILLSGPSGSGKTTTALMLEKMLDEKGHQTHTISIDNYFSPLSEEEKSQLSTGKIDLESPDRIDKELLNEQIKALSEGREICIPRYNFKTSDRDESNQKLQIKNGEIVIFEGIHALNPDVITVPDEMISKIYVSVRTRITCGNIVLHPSKIRLMRRMIRDGNFRQRSYRDTLNMFESVESGENKYIMPYKRRADYDIDTFMAYEMSTYRNFLLDSLHEMNDSPVLEDVTAVLDSLKPISTENVTPDSLICEFIGKGQFTY